jgi:hypothetical protein
MSENVLNRLAEWVETTPGKRWFEQVDRETKAQESAVEERRALVQTIADARRREREELPKLKAAVEQKDAALKAARAAHKAAERARYDAGSAAGRLSDAVRETVRRAEGRLRSTCDARLKDAQELVGDAWHDWSRIWDRLAQRTTVGEFMEARTVITNNAELEALRQELVDTHGAIEKFKLVAEPREEEILAFVARAHAAVAAVGRPAPEAVQP